MELDPGILVSNRLNATNVETEGLFEIPFTVGSDDNWYRFRKITLWKVMPLVRELYSKLKLTAPILFKIPFNIKQALLREI